MIAHSQNDLLGIIRAGVQRIHQGLVLADLTGISKIAGKTDRIYARLAVSAQRILELVYSRTIFAAVAPHVNITAETESRHDILISRQIPCCRLLGMRGRSCQNAS